MASPTYSQQYSPNALSPPHPPTISLPQPPKRRQTDMPTSAPSIKRRKASSSLSHPLRQTSFPPEQLLRPDRETRSPSMDTMSMVSGSAVGTKKRKRKSQINEDTSSAIGRGTKSADGTDKRRAGSRELTVEEDDEVEEMAVSMVARTQEERVKESEQRNMLVRNLDRNQFERYEAWRASRLAESVVRRIVNQTISQSAPATVILAVKAVAKFYAGDIIGAAVRVQKEWIEGGTDKQCSYTPLNDPPREPGQPPRKEVLRGPLLPDHLREALRRLKAERDGGLAGHLNLHHSQSSSGVERFGIKFNGKRMLK